MRRVHSQTIDTFLSLTPELDNYWTLDSNWMEEPAFDWEKHTTNQQTTEVHDSNSIYCGRFPNKGTCLTVDTFDIGDVYALGGDSSTEVRKFNFSSINKPIQFGTDNCAIHHICSDKNLFLDNLN